MIGETTFSNTPSVVSVPDLTSNSTTAAAAPAVVSHRLSLSKQTTMMTLAVPTMSDDEGGGGGSSSDLAVTTTTTTTTTVPHNLHARRCSARLLSLNVREALKQLRQKEHKACVMAVIQRNANFYRRQKCCECITMTTILTLFSAVSLYVMFAYGFYIGKRQPFNLVQDGFQSKVRELEGSSVELWCQANAYWEFCRFVHYDRFCDFEWVGSIPATSKEERDRGDNEEEETEEEIVVEVEEQQEVEGQGVTRTSCDFPSGKVEMVGDYSKFQCAIRINGLDKRDQGLWMCEVEKYYPGFSRRYGELRTATFTIVVSSRNSSSLFGETIPTDSSSYLPDQSISNPATNSVNATTTTITTLMTFSDTADNQEEEYQRQFFLLKVFILGAIGFVLTTLAILFWTYFMYLWRSWDTNKRGGVQEEEAFAAVVDGAEFFDHTSRETLLDSRRKSVSFAVCTPVKEEVGEDGESRLSFDITVRSVPINRNNNDGGSVGGGSKSSSINTVGEVIQVKVSPPMASDPRRRDSSTTAAEPLPVRRLSLAPQDALACSPGSTSPSRRGSLRMEERRSKETPIW